MKTYIGGKDRNRHFNKKSAQVRKAKGPQALGDAVGYGKVGVVGAIARKGNVVCTSHWRDGCRNAWAALFATRWTARVPLLATDEKEDYRFVDRADATIEAIKHSAGEYVRRRSPYEQYRILLEPDQTWPGRHVPSREQGLSCRFISTSFHGASITGRTRKCLRIWSKASVTSPETRCRAKVQAWPITRKDAASADDKATGRTPTRRHRQAEKADGSVD